MRSTPKNTYSTNGFTLIEVLISAFIMGVGLLGVGAMMARSIQANTSAIYRTQAVQLSYEIIDRIRSNEEANYVVDFEDPPGGLPNCEGVNADCNANQLRDFDLSIWKCALGKFISDNTCNSVVNNQSLVSLEFGLPEGDGKIERNVNGEETTYTVTIRWQDKRDRDENNDPILEQFTVKTKI